MVNSILPLVKPIELEIVDDFDNQNKEPAKLHYAENFKEHGESWLRHIKQNMQLNALDSIAFTKANRAIATANTFARALPEQAPDFLHFSLAGQGFPFDNLQESVIWAGTPLYIITTSRDQRWSLVLTPDAYFAWVKSDDIAHASNRFINEWLRAAQHGLVAITKTEASVTDRQNRYQLTGYIGSVFPLVEQNSNSTTVLIPIKNSRHQAVIKIGMVRNNAASRMPLIASKKNMVNLIKELQNRPYGWGGAFFFNDCSQEIKSLFTPFGIWLPRNTAQQAKVGTALDLSKNTVEERINALKNQGHPLMTLIYIEGHVMLYVGNKEMGNHQMEAITYQNIWGLSPASRDKRYVIGQALFFPLLSYYPENPDVISPANKVHFKLIHLDALETNLGSPKAFTKYFTKPKSAVNL